MTANRDLGKLVPLPSVAGQFLWDQATNAWLQVTKAAVGLGNVDNTADANKPVSGPQLTALNLKGNITDPIFMNSLALNQPTTDSMFRIGGNFAGFVGTTGQLFNLAVTVSSSTHTIVRGNNCFLNVGNTASLTDLVFFRAAGGTNTGALLNSYGYVVDTSLAMGSASNRAFVGSLGAATTNFNLYMNGTAANYLNGDLRIGTTAQNGSDKLTVAGAASFTGAAKLGQYTLTTLPSAATFSGYYITVTNATGGPKLCYSNGTNWLIANTTTTVS